MINDPFITLFKMLYKYIKNAYIKKKKKKITCYLLVLYPFLDYLVGEYYLMMKVQGNFEFE